MRKSNDVKLRNQHSADQDPENDPTPRSILDQLDRLVVAALQADGRRAFASIAEELGVAESVVRYRVQRMERSGILQVVGIADPLKLGFDLMALVGVRVVSGSLRAVSASIAALPETSYVASVAGQFDLFVELVCRDTVHFRTVLMDSLQSIDGVKSTESFLILEIHKMAYGWGAGDLGVPLAGDGDSAATTGPRKTAATSRTTKRKLS